MALIEEGEQQVFGFTERDGWLAGFVTTTWRHAYDAWRDLSSKSVVFSLAIYYKVSSSSRPPLASAHFVAKST